MVGRAQTVGKLRNSTSPETLAKAITGLHKIVSQIPEDIFREISSVALPLISANHPVDYHAISTYIRAKFPRQLSAYANVGTVKHWMERRIKYLIVPRNFGPICFFDSDKNMWVLSSQNRLSLYRMNALEAVQRLL